MVYSPDFFLSSNSISTSDTTGCYLNSRGIINFTAGVIAQLTIKPKLEIGIGIEYSKKEYNKTPYFPICPTCQIIFFSSELKLKYIEIPLYARYNFPAKYFNWHLETGLINSFLTNPVSTNEMVLPINKFLLSGELGFGVNYDNDTPITIGVTTIYRYSLTNFSDNASSKLRSLGLMFGMAYRIKKKD